MNPSMANFQRQSLKTRYEWFGNDPETPIKLAGVVIEKAVMSAVRSRQQLGDGGFFLLADFIVRILKSEYPDEPEKDSEVEYKGKKYRVIEVQDHPHSGEWRFSAGEIG